MDKDKSIEQSDTEIQNESLRVQKAQWVKEQVEKQREYEDEIRETLLEEQKILDEMKRSTEEHVERTREMRQYNEENRKQIQEQVYALNGLSEDKLQGMREYKNAYYQGLALALFLLSIALVGLCGYLHGFDSEITLFMIACSGIGGALLSQENKRGKLLDTICRFLYFWMFPMMLVIFVCFELGFQEYEMLLPVFAMAGTIILVVGTGAYFVYNPYRKEKKKIRNAKADLKEIEQEAEKAVKKNQKRRKKEEARLSRIRKREDARLERIQKREEERLVKKEKKEAAKLARMQQKEAAQLRRLQKKEEIKAVLLEKKEEFKAARQQKKMTDTESESIGDNEEIITKDQGKQEKEPEILDASEVVSVEKERIDAKEDVTTEKVEKAVVHEVEDTTEETTVHEVKETVGGADHDTVPKLKIVEKAQ